MEPEFEDAVKASDASNQTSYRFKAVRDDAPEGALSFDLLEARPGSLRLTQPSRRGYERYYGVIALAALLFLLPFLTGLLPWQILVGGTQGLTLTMQEVGIAYLVLALGVFVAGAFYLPRIAERRPQGSLPVQVLEAYVSENRKVPSRLHVRAGSEDVRLTVYATAKALHAAFTLSEQTDYGPLGEDERARGALRP